MDIGEAFFFKERNQRIKQELRCDVRIAHSQHAIVLPHSLAKFGHRPRCAAAFLPLRRFESGMSDGCSTHSLQIETTHAYVARMYRDWSCGNRFSRPQALT